MIKISLRSIRAHPVRFLLTLLAVTLGVGFVAGTFVLRSMMATSFSSLVDTTISSDAYVMAGSGGGGGIGGGSAGTAVPMSYVAEIEALPEVEKVNVSLRGTVVLLGSNDLPVGSLGPPSMLVAFDGDGSGWTFTQGRPPVGDGEIGLEEKTAVTAVLTIGDTTQVINDAGPHDVTVTGIATSGAPQLGAVIVLVDFPTAREWLGAPDTASSLSVDAADGVTQEELVEAITPILSGDFTVTSGDDRRAELNETIDTGLGFVSTFLLIFAAIALFVGGFIIANTFTMTLRERARELALLRALGASPSQIFGSVLVQAFVIGLIGAGLGLAVGMALIYGVRALLDRFGMSFGDQIPLDATTIVVAVVVGVVVCLVASALPARRAALTPPVDAMRESEPSGERPLRVRTILGVSMLVLGLASVTLAVQNQWPDLEGWLLGAGAALALFGTLVVAPALGRWVLAVLSAPFVALFRPMGRLAKGNVTRHPRRTANTAGALVIGMALVGASATLAQTMNSSTADLVREEITAPFMLQSMSLPIPTQLMAQISELPEVTYVHRFTVTVAQVDGAPRLVDAVDMAVFGDAFNVPVVAGSLDDVTDGTIVLRADEAGGAEIGDVLKVSGPGGTEELRVVAILDSKTISVYGFVTDTTMAQLNPSPGALFAFVGTSATDEAGLESLRTELENLARPYQVVSVLDAQQLGDFISEQVNRMLAIMYALLGLSIIIAILGIVNTLALSVMERTREIGLLRAVGLGRLQTASIIAIESVIIALFGTVLGLALGVGLAAAVQQVYADVGLTALAIPWGQLAIMVGLAGVVGLFAAIWPAIRAARLPVLEAVSVE